MTVIAIDGPAAAGKSTVARRVAQHLGWRYLDTGAMYRAVALAALEAGLEAEDADALAQLARSVQIEVTDGRLLLDGRDVTERIRDDDVTAIVSAVSAEPEVRAALVEKQRAVAARHDVVMEGRDIGSAVVPDAGVKVFLTASLRERARRRLEQLGRAEDDGSLRAMEASIAGRDAADEARTASPLQRPAGASVLDSSAMSVDEVVNEIVSLAVTRGGVRNER